MRPFTAAQREAITRSTHVLIEAGAGSGKTTTLVGKLLYLLGAELPGIRPAPEAERCELDRIAAITFTNAAAADLKESLRRAMREQAERTGERIWRGRVYQIERARIGTIHAFCGAILREFGLRDGLDPAFRVLDEAEAALLRAEAVREEIFASVASAGDGDTPRLLARFGLRGTTEMVDAALRAGQAVRDAWAAWCEGTPGGVQLDQLRARLTEQGLGVWRRHDPEAARLAGAMAGLAFRARERLETALDEMRALDFDALIYRTRTLLHRREDVLAALRARLDWLFIDEFQDTDPAQKDIAYALCGLPREHPGAPRLCIVGDPKQSIYRFRRADVRLWNHVAADFGSLGSEPVRLDRNFRSRAPIVDFVNAVFAPLMGDEARARENAYEVAYTPLTAHRAAAGDAPAVELVLVGGGDADTRRADEAERLAARMLELREDGQAVHEDTRADGPAAPRAARWSDFAILFRTRTALRYYEAALRRHRIPYRVAGNTGFFERREVLDLRLLLAWLADPDDDAALAGILRSPFVALTDASLLRICMTAQPRPLRQGLDAALPEPDQRERLEEGRRWLEELRALRDRVPAGALLERALDGSGYLPQLLFEEGGEVAAANVRKLHALADAHPGWSLRELVDFIDAGADAAAEAEAGVHTEGEEVVTLTTVHQAKGLEWPIVVLADLEGGIGVGHHQEKRLILDPDGGISLRLEDDEADKDERLPGAYEHLLKREDDLSRIEEKRVWYVAATRARERLILCVGEGAFEIPAPKKAPPDHVISPAEDAKTAAQWLCHVLAERGSERSYEGTDGRWTVALRTEVRRPPPTEPPPEPPLPEELTAASGDAGLAARIASLQAPRDGRVHSATELMSFQSDRKEHRRIYGLGLPPRYGAGAAAGPPDVETAGIEIGTMLHGILERLRTLADLERLLDRELGGTMGPEDAEDARTQLREQLARMVERTARHPRVAPLLAKETTERELNFTWIVPRGEAAAEPVILRGALDLAGAGRRGVGDVVDYKSNRIAAGEEMREAGEYALQRDVYVAALLELTGEPPDRFTFLFSRTGRGVEAEPLPLEASAARGRVVAELKRMLA